jgi:hypothetical protein
MYSLRKVRKHSLKTTNEQTAIHLGRRLLFQMERRADQGLPPKSKLFAVVIDDYIRYRERDHRHGKTSAGMLRQIIRVSKFWRDYAGGMPVDAIDFLGLVARWTSGAYDQTSSGHTLGDLLAKTTSYVCPFLILSRT